MCSPGPAKSAGSFRCETSSLGAMLDRLSWFVTGVVAGGLITVRALRRRPRPRDLKAAALQTGADVMDLAARVVQPPRRRLFRIR
jgi:hypothetical protein